jgi:lipopolysaccharide export system protein LptA
MGAALLGLMLVTASPATAQNMGIETIGAGGKSLPVNIAADDGIEWRQADHVYIARGNVKAVRGDVTVYADGMRAYYRPVAKKPGAAKPKPPAPLPAATAPGKPRKPGGPELNEGSTEVYRLEAIGHVKFVTKTQTGYGDHADYDIDKTMLVMTGKHLRIIGPHDTLTARDSIEWYDNRQLGVARGDAVDDHDGKHIAGDVLIATFVHGAPGQKSPGQESQVSRADAPRQKSPGQESQVSRIDAQGHVVVTSNDQVGRGDTGVYDVKSGIVTLTGHVRLTRGQNQLNGAYGVVDVNRNIGHLLPAPPGARVARGSPYRVEGLIMPNTKPAAGKPGVKKTAPRSRAGKSETGQSEP